MAGVRTGHDLFEVDKKHYGDFERNIQLLSEQRISDAGRAAVGDVKENFKKYATARVRWFELMGEGKTEEATSLRAQALTPAGGATVAAINKVVDLERKEAEAGFKTRNMALVSTSIWLLGGCILVIALTVIFVFSLVRSLRRRLSVAASPRSSNS